MKIRLLLTLVKVITLSFYVGAQSIIITEIMADVHPWLDEPRGEWIELYNISLDTINLKNWSFRDAADNIVVFDEDCLIPPGMAKVITNDSSYSKIVSFFDYGLKGNKGNISMNNGSEFVILNDGIEDVFMFQYDDGDYYGDGFSLELKTLDFAEDGVVHQDELRSGGVDGTPNEYTPSLGDVTGLPPVIITEIMADAHEGLPEPEGEWIELYNTTNDSINVKDFIIKDAANNQFSIDSNLIIPPFTARVISNDSSMSHVLSFFNYGLKGNKGNIAMNNGSEFVILNNGIEDIFIFSYSDGSIYGQGHSMELVRLDYAIDGIVTEDEMLDPGIDGTPNFFRNSILPVELISFEIKKEDHRYFAYWESGMESNLDYYTLEWSSDNRSYQRLKDIEIKNAYSDGNRYQIKLPQFEPGSYYVRLKNTELNGHQQILGIRTLRINKESEQTVAIYTKETGVIYIENLTVDRDCIVEFFSIDGKKQSSFYIDKGSSVELQGALPFSGIYLYRILDLGGNKRASSLFHYIVPH